MSRLAEGSNLMIPDMAKGKRDEKSSDTIKLHQVKVDEEDSNGE